MQPAVLHGDFPKFIKMEEMETITMGNQMEKKTAHEKQARVF